MMRTRVMVVGATLVGAVAVYAWATGNRTPSDQPAGKVETAKVMPAKAAPPVPPPPAPPTPKPPTLPAIPDPGPVVPIPPPVIPPVAPVLPPLPAAPPMPPVIPPPSVTLPDPPAFLPVPPILPVAGTTPAAPPDPPRIPGLPLPSDPSIPAIPRDLPTTPEASIPPSPPIPAAPKFTPLVAVPEGVTPAYVNLSRVRIKYEVTKAGPSGVGTVELWLKDQNGWSRAADVKSGEPLEVELPTDGAYGVKVVPVSGQGVRGAEPGKESTPDMWVVRDTVKPGVTVNVFPTPLQEGMPQAVPFVVEVTIDEANLNCQEVSFMWRDSAGVKKGVTDADSPLFTGAELTKAKGKLETKIGTFVLRPPPKDGEKSKATKMVFDWTPAAEVPARVVIGVAASDRAGNKDAARAEIGTDLTEPAAKVTGVQVVPGK